MSRLVVRRGDKKDKKALRGTIRVPGDKSISHRALLIGALADGSSRIEGFLPAGDCTATLDCVRALGIKVETHTPTNLTVHGRGLRGLQAPDAPLDCARSGTTLRLLAGILAGQSFDSVLTGAEQLLRRPMRRIVEPLRQMGARIEAVDGRAPLTIRGHELSENRDPFLKGCEHTLSIASAQVKSALLLAGLYATGPTTVRQPGPTRDHTERTLEAMGASITIDGLDVTLEPPASLAPFDMSVPGDISSAAFPLVAALLIPGSELTVEAVGVNETRTGLLDVLRRMGATVTLANEREQCGEPVADVTVHASELASTEIGGHTVVRMIDEFPILAIAATQARGMTTVCEAAELRVKETDRISAIVAGLQKLGAQIAPLPDGFIVEGPTPLKGGTVDCRGDHRLAMALTVAGLIAEGETVIEHAACIPDSFPGFVDLMRSVSGGEMDYR
ncbi:MAG TPA: 3-phosphoshikimate 1-carboxyvinyltransferase [Chloroflexi bacterium]|nr:3-phosphoshikimate 1-carboxyvinyltransferase [Chloroflexota bacterium]